MLYVLDVPHQQMCANCVKLYCQPPEATSKGGGHCTSVLHVFLSLTFYVTTDPLRNPQVKGVKEKGPGLRTPKPWSDRCRRRAASAHQST